MTARATNASRALAVAAALVLLVAVPAAGAADPSWRLEQPPPPPGAEYKVPLGAPGDLQFWAPNKGLLGVEGNAVVPRGLLYWDGRSWRQLSTVCGGTGDSLRIAWAGPSEFWTVSEPSRPRLGSGTTLCRFKDGAIVASYGTAPESPDPYRPMNAATCRAADDCWFGGVAAQDGTGQRSGAFRLHWDGVELRTVYGPQGRGISDMEFHDGRAYESLLVGGQPGDPAPPELATPEDVPRLLHRLDGSSWVNDPFEPQERDGVPVDGTELLGLESDGTDLWAVGGGAASGPSAPQDSTVARPPLAARLLPGVGFFELPLNAPDGTFGEHDRFADVAPLPGSSDAWVTVQPYAERKSTNVRAKVARINGATGEVELQRLPAAGSGRGSAARIACPSPTECWMATYGGWLFHWTDGAQLEQDTDPAFQKLITFRPNEAAAQFVPDAPPVDDSQLLAPPPVQVEAPPAPQQTVVKKLKALLARIRTKLKGTTLTVTFTLRRKARVAVIAERRGKVVKRTRSKVLKPGRYIATLRLDPKRWPTKLRFYTKETRKAAPTEPVDTGTDTGGDGPTVVG